MFFFVQTLNTIKFTIPRINPNPMNMAPNANIPIYK